MGSKQVIIELPEDMYERVVDASRLTDTPLDAMILGLVERGLAGDVPVPSRDAANNTLRERIRQAEAVSDQRRRIFDPENAARRRAMLPRLDPPISQTVIEDREERY